MVDFFRLSHESVLDATGVTFQGDQSRHDRMQVRPGPILDESRREDHESTEPSLSLALKRDDCTPDLKVVSLNKFKSNIHPHDRGTSPFMLLLFMWQNGILYMTTRAYMTKRISQ